MDNECSSEEEGNVIEDEVFQDWVDAELRVKEPFPQRQTRTNTKEELNNFSPRQTDIIKDKLQNSLIPYAEYFTTEAAAKFLARFKDKSKRARKKG